MYHGFILIALYGHFFPDGQGENRVVKRRHGSGSHSQLPGSLHQQQPILSHSTSTTPSLSLGPSSCLAPSTDAFQHVLLLGDSIAVRFPAVRNAIHNFPRPTLRYTRLSLLVHIHRAQWRRPRRSSGRNEDRREYGAAHGSRWYWWERRRWGETLDADDTA